MLVFHYFRNYLLLLHKTDRKDRKRQKERKKERMIK
jgi:hypothetical protein